MRQSLMAAALAAGCCAILAGCGPSGANPTNLVAVKAKVVHADGKPVGFVTVGLYPTAAGSAVAYGTTDESGVCGFKSLNDKDGAVPGTFKVSLTNTNKTSPKLDNRYKEEATSGLTVTVPGSGGEVTITVP